uniref:Uncharacterized protein n=1 Tax=Onchocerca volvulus TaxID=6282 RepID=A0A2K6W307_ONCVO
MPSRLGPRSGSAVVQQIPRQVKKVSVPIVPDSNTQKYRTCQTNIVKPVAAEDFYHLERPVVLQQRNGLLESRKYCKSKLYSFLSNMKISMIGVQDLPFFSRTLHKFPIYFSITVFCQKIY